MRKRTWALATAAVVAALGGQAFGQQAKPPAPVQTAANSKPAAVVNGEPISLAQIDAVINRDGPKGAQAPETKLSDMRHAVLASMIDDVLFQQYIRKNFPPANPQEVAQELANMQEGLKKAGKTLDDFCKENVTTPAELKDDLADIVRWRTFVQSRTTDAELQRYFNENRDFFDQVAVRASHIVLRTPQGMSDAEKQAAFAKLKAIRQDIVSGKIDFAAAAKQYSQDVSKDNGGDLNFFPRKFMYDESFSRAAFALKVGEVSDVVQTDFGYHLIKVTDRKPGTPADFVKMKEDVREVYVTDMHNAIVLQQRKVAKVEVNLP